MAGRDGGADADQREEGERMQPAGFDGMVLLVLVLVLLVLLVLLVVLRLLPALME